MAITDEEKKKVEREKIKKDMRVCGYPEWALRHGETNCKESRDEREREKEKERELKEEIPPQRRRGNMWSSSTVGYYLKD